MAKTKPPAPVVIESADTGAPTFQILQLNSIVASSHNPRVWFNEPRLVELAESIQAAGVHQPILVRPLPASRLQETFEDRRKGDPLPEYEIVDGERRFRASKLAERESIPAMVKHMTDDQVLEAQLVANLQRDGLHPMEEAEGYERLCDATGISKEDIGGRIGRSRGYVYARLKLLDLCADARKAFLDEKIDSSRALVIARIPGEKLQLQALKAASESTFEGDSKMGFRAFQAWTHQNVMLPLGKARFDIANATLVDAAGPCTDCPKRTGAQPEVYADVDADVCTDPGCYHDKQKTHDEIEAEKLRADGRKVIDPTKAAALVKNDHGAERFKGYLVLDQYPPWSLGIDGTSVRKALGKHCPAPVLVMDPQGGGLVECAPLDEVKKIIKEHGLSRSAKRDRERAGQAEHAQKKDERRPIEERSDYQRRWKERTAEKIDTALRTRVGTVPASALRSLLMDRFRNLDESPFGLALDLGDEFDTSEVEARITASSDEEISRLFLRWMLHDELDSYDAWRDLGVAQQPRTILGELAVITGVDHTEVQADVRREIESEDRAKDLEAEAKAATPAKGKKASAKTAPPAARGGSARRASPEQAQRDISEALQAAEGADAPAGGDGQEAPSLAPDGAVSEDQDQAPAGAEQEGAAPAAPVAPLSPVAAWPFPQAAREAVDTFAPGALAKVKADVRGPSGHKRKTCGRVGVVEVVTGNQVQLRHGPKPHEVTVLHPSDLEPYKADPLPGARVRILNARGLDMSRSALEWQEGTVGGVHADGWEVSFAAADGQPERTERFAPTEMEVLA